MISKDLKQISFLLLFIGLTSAVSAQNFIKDYRDFMIGISHPTQQRKALIDTAIKRLSLTLNRFEKENKHSFFNTDTVFMVAFYGSESGSTSEIIWNRNSSCFYRFDYDLEKGKTVKQKLDIKTGVSDYIRSFDPEFRIIVESGDTADYRKYAYKHRVYDGEHVSPVIAIKSGLKWKFTTFKSDGWAMDCYNTFVKRDASTNVNTIINSLSKEHFGFNIDSANAAYTNDTSKLKKLPQYPVILLDGKVISYNQLGLIKLYSIKTISVWNKNSHNPEIPNDISEEFGIIAISTDRKSN